MEFYLRPPGLPTGGPFPALIHLWYFSWKIRWRIQISSVALTPTDENLMVSTSRQDAAIHPSQAYDFTLCWSKNAAGNKKTQDGIKEQ